MDLRNTPRVMDRRVPGALHGVGHWRERCRQCHGDECWFWGADRRGRHYRSGGS